MAINIRRREFIATLGSAAVAWPLAAHAQLPAMPVIGYLTSGAPGLFHADPASAPRAVFVQGLAESGYVEGRNVAIEYSLGGRPLRAAARDGSRSGAPASQCDRHPRQHRHGEGRESGDVNNSDRVRHRSRSGRSRAGCQPKPARRQSHRCRQIERRA